MLVSSIPSTQLVLSSSLTPSNSLSNLPGAPTATAAPSQDVLDVAILQSQKRLEAVHHEAMKLERKCIFYIGKRCHGLEEEESALRKELIAKQHNVEFLPKLYQEKWTAHLAATHASMKALPAVIDDCIKSFKQFQASFPQEAISKVQENAIPSQEWLTRLKTFVNERQAGQAGQAGRVVSPLPQMAEAVQQIVRVHVEDSMLVAAASMQGVVPYLQELRGLEDHITKMKGELLVCEEREQSLRTHHVQTIESWNKVFSPYLDTAHRFQEIVVKFLQQQNTALSQLDEEYFRLKSKDLSYAACSPAKIQDLMRLIKIPGERGILTQKLDQASPLQKQIDLIVSLVEKMVFKQSQPIEECKR